MRGANNKILYFFITEVNVGIISQARINKFFGIEGFCLGENWAGFRIKFSISGARWAGFIITFVISGVRLFFLDTRNNLSHVLA